MNKRALGRRLSPLRNVLHGVTWTVECVRGSAVWRWACCELHALDVALWGILLPSLGQAAFLSVIELVACGWLRFCDPWEGSLPAGVVKPVYCRFAHTPRMCSIRVCNSNTLSRRCRSPLTTGYPCLNPKPQTSPSCLIPKPHHRAFVICWHHACAAILQVGGRPGVWKASGVLQWLGGSIGRLAVLGVFGGVLLAASRKPRDR